MNDLDASLSMKEYLEKWDETYRRDVKYFHRSQIAERTEQERIRFYKLTPPDQAALLDEEVNRAISTTDLFVPERRVFNANERKSARKHSNSESVLDQMMENLDHSILKSIESVASRESTSAFAFINSNEDLIDQMNLASLSAIVSHSRINK
jgi:6-pyruvoyl-tetrahydropterin synthase